MNENRIILNITPQTALRVLPSESILFRIPEVCLKGRRKKGCVQYHRTGLCKHTLYAAGRIRKRRIEKYNKYKVDVLTLAKQAGFEMPICGWSLYFYFPMPKRWPNHLRKTMQGQMKISKPDADNILKGIFDSLSITDERVAQLSGVGKFWVDTMSINNQGEKVYGAGWIEILINQPLYNPFGVEFIDQDALKKTKKRKYEKTQEHAEFWVNKKAGIKNVLIKEEDLFKKEKVLL